MSENTLPHESTGLRKGLIKVLAATVEELFDDIEREHGKRIKQLEDAVVLLNVEIHELQRLHRQLQQDISQAVKVLPNVPDGLK